jgi:hypothetical protein
LCVVDVFMVGTARSGTRERKEGGRERERERGIDMNRWIRERERDREKVRNKTHTTAACLTQGTRNTTEPRKGRIGAHRRTHLMDVVRTATGLQVRQDGRLAAVVQADDADLALLLAEPECLTHGVKKWRRY